MASGDRRLGLEAGKAGTNGRTAKSDAEVNFTRGYSAGGTWLLGNEVVMGLGCGGESYDVDPLREANASEGGARVN